MNTKRLLLCAILATSLPISGHAFWSKYLQSAKIHQSITSAALGALVFKVDGKSYAFPPYVIDIVNQSHPKADSSPYDERDHFDSESFASSFNRLADRRAQLMNELAQQSPNMRAVDWPLLGYMLHQVQDFYSHSTWIQSGQTDIANFGAATKPGALTLPKFVLDHSQIGTVCSGAASIITPVVAVTSGYYTDGYTHVASQPPPPTGKCSHGAVVAAGYGCTGLPFSNSPDGINHDHPCFVSDTDVDIYYRATKLAERESQSFIQAILDDLMASANRRGVCLLMGLDQSAAPCLGSCGLQASRQIAPQVPYRGFGGSGLNLTVAAAGVTQPWNGQAGYFGKANLYGVGVILANNESYNSVDIVIQPTPYATGSFQGMGEMQGVRYSATAFNFPPLEYAISSPNTVTIASFTNICTDTSAGTELDTYTGTINVGLVLENPGNPNPEYQSGTLSGTFSGSEYVCQKGKSPVFGTQGSSLLTCK